MNIKSIKNKAIRFRFYLLITGILFTASCAKIVVPTGGPKDVTPPKILQSIPENYSVNFKQKKVVVKFDEYFQLKNLNKELLVSPPLKEQPIIRVSGKNLIIEIKDTLHDNTTYNINFHDAIVDVNESNILSNYQYCFSTGNHIDSLFVRGFIYDAFSLEPKQFVKVMLYENYNDSTPYKKIPDYISQTNKEGQFSINNIKSGNYHIFALNDGNNNLLFDQPSEEIAFLDSLIIPGYKEVEFVDTLQIIDKIIGNDTIHNDTIYKDTIIIHNEFVSKIKSLDLYMFQEDYEKQYIEKTSRDKKEKCVFIFHKPSNKKCEILPINFDTQSKKWNIIENSINNDTVICWLTDSIIYKHDSLIFELKYNKTNILRQDSLVSDTVTLVYTEKGEIPKKKKRKKEENKELTQKVYLNIITNIMQKVDLNQNIILTPESPIQNYDTSKIQLFLLKDSTEILQQATFTKDSILLRKFCLSNKWEENSKYKLIIYPEAFTDIYNCKNDTIERKFKTKESDYYGSIKLEINNIITNSIVQLLNEKEKILREFFILNDTTFNINYLNPKKHLFKLIIDKNNNRKWDTGNFIKKIQPEKVYYYKDLIEIKSNWDNEIIWDIEK